MCLWIDVETDAHRVRADHIRSLETVTNNECSRWRPLRRFLAAEVKDVFVVGGSAGSRVIGKHMVHIRLKHVSCDRLNISSVERN